MFKNCIPCISRNVAKQRSNNDDDDDDTYSWQTIFHTTNIDPELLVEEEEEGRETVIVTFADIERNTRGAHILIAALPCDSQ